MKNFISTRQGQLPVGFYLSIVQGIGDDGGLLVPDFELPKLDLSALLPLDYISLATEILSVFVAEEDKTLINEACAKAYSGAFPKEVVPVRKAGDCWIAELFHGRTAAFKDMALCLLPYLMKTSLSKIGEHRKVMILVATSGDTGKAALEGFKDVEGTEIMVFYPTDGVSEIQKRQMLSQEGGNVNVVGIEGNFDDAQRAVKEAFSDSKLSDLCETYGVFLSSANSINIGRLLPQIVYYVWSYLELVRKGEIGMGEKINFCVPSGNFGNCLAGWMAKEMGLPVQRFLVASNKNNVLSDFFSTGVYDIRREFHKTIAPAMDILVSSNLERLLWFVCDRDGSKVRSLMESLRRDGRYEIKQSCLERLKRDFSAGYLDEEQVLQTINDCFEANGYLLDTHTACAYGYLQRYRQEYEDKSKCVIMATASPYKFPDSVLEALTGEPKEAQEAARLLERHSKIAIPDALKGIWTKKVLHKTIIGKGEIGEFIKSSIVKEKSYESQD